MADGIAQGSAEKDVGGKMRLYIQARESDYARQAIATHGTQRWVR